MKVSVDFPSVAGREGPDKVHELARAIESIGFDEIAVFDHVVMGHPTADRPSPRYPPTMPILEAVVLLAQIAAVTTKIGLSTEVLVLPQRQPALVAKQFATLDMLSQGRIRLGVGVGWQESEYEALGEDFSTRGRRMDDAIRLLRAYWTDEAIDFNSDYYPTTAMALEPKPPQGAKLPIWIGGHSDAAIRRVATLGDGWMGPGLETNAEIEARLEKLAQYASEAGRDPKEIGTQFMVQPPPRSEEDKHFYANHDRVVERVEQLAQLGVDWVSLNATAVFQAGARSVSAMIEDLGQLHTRISDALGS